MSEQKLDEPGDVENVEPVKKDDDDAENDIKLPKEGDLKDVDEEEEEKQDEEFIKAAEEGKIAEDDQGEKPPKEDIEGEEKKEVEVAEGGAETEAAEKTEEGEEKEPKEAEEPGGKEEVAPEIVKEPSVKSIEEKEPPKEPVEKIDRNFYIERYKQLMEEKTELNMINTLYNKKSIEYFRRKKVAITPREDIHDIDLFEKNYTNLLWKFDEYLKTVEQEKELNKIAEKTHEKSYQKKLNRFSKEFTEIQSVEKQVAKKLLSTANGKPISNEVIQRFIKKQGAKLKELIEMRLEYIVTRNLLSKLEKNLKDVDRLDEGFHVKEYEKLQAANDAYMIKLEERDATLIKQKAVCATYVEMLAHMKEEMNLETKKVDEAKNNLHATEHTFSYMRRRQTDAKHKLRNFKEKLRIQQDKTGLSNHPKLYEDFKKTRKMISQLKTDLEVLVEELERSKTEKAFNKKPSIFENDCVPLKIDNPKVRPKFHKSAYLP